MSKPAPKIDAWMPLWIGAYLADTQHLSRDEHGAYLLLIMAYWRGAAPLADDDKRLAAIVKASADEWTAMRPVLAEFFICRDGLWRHKRIDHELADAAAKKTKASIHGQAGANARWGSESGKCSGNARALPEQCPTPTPTPTPEKSVGKGSAPQECRTAAAALAQALRVRGVNVTPANPLLLRWLQDGYTPEQIHGALEIARASKPAPLPMPAKYLDTVLRAPQARRTQKSRNRSIHDERAATLAALTGTSLSGTGAGPPPAAGREPIEGTAERVG